MVFPSVGACKTQSRRLLFGAVVEVVLSGCGGGGGGNGIAGDVG